MIANQEELQANQEETEDAVKRHEVPNKEAAVETRSTGGPIWGPAIGFGMPKLIEKADSRRCTRNP
jgi:hypothetical protein